MEKTLEQENKEIIEELRKQYPIDEIVKFDETTIQMKLSEQPFNSVIYSELHMKELGILEDLEEKLEALTAQRYKYYRFDDDKEWTKPEIEKYCIPNDNKIRQMKKIIAKQKVRVRFFEICYKAINQMGWRMKTYMDSMKGGY